jgi:hypothetical protein
VGDMGDGDQSTSVITLGYDPQKGRFVGTWLGSMITFLWHYDGELDAGGKVLTLNSQGPDMSGATDKLANYRDIIELADADHYILRGQAEAEDGSWTEFMRMDYYRVK